MKTNYSLRQLSLYSVLGLLGIAATSCSSYQSASKYDNDGIYGSVPRDTNNNAVYTYNDGNVTEYRDGEVEGQNMNYKEYFQDMQDEYPVFTDVENYSSYDNDTIVYVEDYNAAPGWGEDHDNVTVNVYGGNAWGYPYYPYYGGWGLGWNSWYGGWGGYYGGWGVSLGWGWGNGWYSPYYYGGWGGYYGGYYPYYGGYNNYYNGRYGTRNNNYYNGGRNSYYNAGRFSNRNNRSSVTANGRRNSTFSTNRSSINRSNGTTIRSSRSVSPSVRRTAPATTPRYNNSTRTNRSYTPARSSSPSRSSGTFSTPSRSSSGSSGGGRSGGSSSGGRSGGGGRRG